MTSSSNRFAVFMEDSEGGDEEVDWVGSPDPPDCASFTGTAPVPAAPKKFTCLYSLTTGTESVQHVRSVPIQQQVGSINTLNAISFFGRCFQCQYMSHSQKYCPLRQCKACKLYGHSETVCRRQKSAARGFLDSVERVNGLHGLLLTKLAVEVEDTVEDAVEEEAVAEGVADSVHEAMVE